MVEVWEIERRLALARAAGRSRVWRCCGCGKLSGTEHLAPPPPRCRACAGTVFSKMDDRRRRDR